MCNYSVSAEYSVRYSAEYFGRNRFRSVSSERRSVCARKERRLQGVPSASGPGLGRLRFEMLHHLARLLSRFCQNTICISRIRQRAEPDKKIRGMAQQGLCHQKFSKCVQNKQSDWSDFKGSSKQAI